VNLAVTSWGNEITWNIDGGATFGPYNNYNEYSQVVSLNPGTHTLNYLDSYGDGWHGGWIDVVGYTGQIYPSGYGGSTDFTV